MPGFTQRTCSPTCGLLYRPVRTLKTRLERANPEAQDFGTTLVLVVLEPLLLSPWPKEFSPGLKGHSGASMEIRTEQGQVIVRNAESKTLADIAEAFASAIQK